MASGLQKVPWTHPGLARILAAILVDTPSLLDVGSGTGIIGALCRVYHDVDPWLAPTRMAQASRCAAAMLSTISALGLHLTQGPCPSRIESPQRTGA